MDHSTVADLALQLDVAGRLAGRHPTETLAREAGSRATASLVATHLWTCHSEALILDLAAHVADRAAALEIPIAFLKFAGMHHAGIRGRGWRGASDVDVLAPPLLAERLLEGLVATGCRRSGMPGYDHQLPMIVEARGGIDIHVHVPEIRLAAGSGFMDFAAGAEAGLLAGVAALPGDTRAPSRVLLLAHTVGHGIGHHGMAPESYPLLRMIGDVVDIAPSDDEAGRAAALLEHDVSRRELDAVLALARNLERGDLAFASGGTDAALLLRHVLAGVFDPDYRSSLKIRPLDTSPRSLARQAWSAVALTDAQLDAVYGRHTSRLGYTLRRIARPLDLVRRTVQAAAASRRVRRRG